MSDDHKLKHFRSPALRHFWILLILPPQHSYQLKLTIRAHTTIILAIFCQLHLLYINVLIYHCQFSSIFSPRDFSNFLRVFISPIFQLFLIFFFSFHSQSFMIAKGPFLQFSYSSFMEFFYQINILELPEQFTLMSPNLKVLFPRVSRDQRACSEACVYWHGKRKERL